MEINKGKYIIIGLMSKMFTNGPGDWDSIPGQKLVLDAALLNTAL